MPTPSRRPKAALASKADPASRTMPHSFTISEPPEWWPSTARSNRGLTQAPGGACFQGGSCVSDYATFLHNLGAAGIVAFNGYTDFIPKSAASMVVTADAAGMSILEWENDNEPYDFGMFFPTPANYAAAAYSPFYQDINATNPSAAVGVFFEGPYVQELGNYTQWDSGMAAYSPQYWQGVSFHVYPITNTSISTSDEEQTLNGILAYGSTDFFLSYVQPLIGQTMPVFFTEVNSGPSTMPFEQYIYNAIFCAEFTARMSVIPQVRAIGISTLYFGNSATHGLIRAVNDYETYLLEQIQANPNYSTDTSTNPNTQFSFYYSPTALAMGIA